MARKEKENFLKSAEKVLKEDNNKPDLSTPEKTPRVRRTREQLLEAGYKSKISGLKSTMKKPVPPATVNPVVTDIIKNLLNTVLKIDIFPELVTTTEEAEKIATPLNQLMLYYMPGMGGIGAVWFSLGLSTVTIIGGKIAIMKKLNHGRKKDTSDIGAKGNGEKHSSEEPIKPEK